jgi:hypothetical protein
MAYRLAPEAEADLQDIAFYLFRKRETSNSLIGRSSSSLDVSTCWLTTRVRAALATTFVLVFASFPSVTI